MGQYCYGGYEHGYNDPLLFKASMVLWSRQFYGWILSNIAYGGTMKALFDGMSVASIPIFRILL